MPIAVRVPHGLSWCTDGRRIVEAEGGTLREVWKDLHTRYPELMWRVSLEQGPPGFWVSILVDGRMVDKDNGLDIDVSTAEEVTLRIIPGNAPGSGAFS